MCGLAGFVDLSTNPKTDDLTDNLQRMVNTLRHRGPDDRGLWVDAQLGLALGHTRLAIIDLSSEGHQPMMSPGGRYQLVFNGEIYNHGVLRKQLEEEGARFRGHSDTEVLLMAIERWGIDQALKELIGMFAFAVWDHDERALYFARDRLGEKPLYYGLMGRILLFGSELKALRAHSKWRGQIDRNSLTLFVRHNYIPTPWSIYQDVFKLPPGSLLRVEYEALRSGATFTPLNTVQSPNSIQPQQYWSPKQARNRGVGKFFAGNENEALDLLHPHHQRCVQFP